MKKAWQLLNGNKTIICMTIATALQQAISYGIINDSNAISYIINMFVLFGTGSLAHHAKKGYFKQNKGG